MTGRRPGCLRWLLIIGLLGAVIYIFRFEIDFLLNFFETLILGYPVAGFPEIDRAVQLILFMLMNVLFALLILVWAFQWMSSAIFPVMNYRQANQLMIQIFQSIFAAPRSILSVREGKLDSTNVIRDAFAIKVDLESAVVIESQQLNGRYKNPVQGKSGLPEDYLKTKVLGPGFHTKKRAELLRDVVPLRSQLRIQPNVRGQTSDGIELSTNVEVKFTLSQAANIFHVMYHGEPSAENIIVVDVDPITRRIQAIKDELDLQDKQEIHETAQEYLFQIEASSPLMFSSELYKSPPFPVDVDRIQAAVYSRAHDLSDLQSTSRWSDLPAMIAAEVFRNLIARYTLDDLFLPEDPQNTPWLNDLKPQFSRRMQNLGILAYQFCFHLGSQSPEFGERIDHKHYRISRVYEAHGSKLLRDRGIKVLDASFSEIIPTDPNIHQQRLNNWQMRWQNNADEILVDREQDLIRMKNASRTETISKLANQISSRLEKFDVPEADLVSQILMDLNEIAVKLIDRSEEGSAFMSRLLLIRSWLGLEIPNKPSPFSSELVDSGESE